MRKFSQYVYIFHYNFLIFLFADLPKFGEPIQNVTVPIGREATLSCTIDNLQTYKVIFIIIFQAIELSIMEIVVELNANSFAFPLSIYHTKYYPLGASNLALQLFCAIGF